MTHICPKCKVEKELCPTNFKQMKVKGKVYLEKTCKACRQKAASQRERERYQNDPDFKHKKVAATEQWRVTNQLNRSEHWQKRLESNRQWRKSHSDEIRAANAGRHAKRWANPTYRVSKNMSNRVNCLIKDKDGGHIFTFLSYSINELMAHLEKQFLPGMTWGNYGEWHIDHIKPVCSFSFTSKHDAEFKECWKLENLRPLWAKDNLIKSTSDKLLSARDTLHS